MGAKILIVDDDEFIRELVESLLLEQQYEVTGACDGNEAERLLQGHSFDLVITDYKMPGINGKKLAKTHPEVPFLLMTGVQRVADSTNPEMLIVKPIQYDDLLFKTERLVSRKSA